MSRVYSGQLASCAESLEHGARRGSRPPQSEDASPRGRDMKDVTLRGGELSSGAPGVASCVVCGHCPLLTACASSQVPHRDATVGNVHSSTGGTLGTPQQGELLYTVLQCRHCHPSNDCALSMAQAHGEMLTCCTADAYTVALFTTSKTEQHSHRRSSPP